MGRSGRMRVSLLGGVIWSAGVSQGFAHDAAPLHVWPWHLRHVGMRRAMSRYQTDWGPTLSARASAMHAAHRSRHVGCGGVLSPSWPSYMMVIASILTLVTGVVVGCWASRIADVPVPRVDARAGFVLGYRAAVAHASWGLRLTVPPHTRHGSVFISAHTTHSWLRLSSSGVMRIGGTRPKSYPHRAVLVPHPACLMW